MIDPSLSPSLLESLRAIARYDVSVSVDGLGTVFKDERDSPLGRAQHAIASVYGTARAYMLTNGTTQANVLAVSALASPGDKILIQRNSHVSVYAPILNLGLDPISLDPTYVTDWDIVGCITPEQLEHALSIHAPVRVVFLTSPNYFGVVGNLEALIDISHRYGARVIVDEAHGAYFNFLPNSLMPAAAERLGADLVTQSTHKTLGALGQGSLLLLNDRELSDALYEVINALGYVSTSFSYPILASVSLAVAHMALEGENLLRNAIDVSQTIRARINTIDGLRCFGQEIIDAAKGVCSFDPLRITVNVRQWGVTGFDVERELNAQGICPELATFDNVLFLMTPFDDRDDIPRIIGALEHVERNLSPYRESNSLPIPPSPRKVSTPREAFYHPRRRKIGVENAIGCVSCETIAAYPPGTAIIVMGEEITKEAVEYLIAVKHLGGRLKGASDVEFKTMNVVPS